MNSKSAKKIKIIFILSIFFAPIFSFAQVIHSTIHGGGWNNPETWEEGVIPNEDDEVILKTKIDLPNKLKIKSLKLENGNFSFYHSDIEVSDFFEVGENATFQTRSNYGVHEFKIKTKRFINNGIIKYPIKLFVEGDFVNNGNLDHGIHWWNGSVTWPEIHIDGNIENNTLIDTTDFCFRFEPNTTEKKYYIYGGEPTNLCLDSGNSSGEYYFKGDLNLNYFLNLRGENKIFLDNTKVLKINEGSGRLELPNNNKIILGQNKGEYYANWNITAPSSDIFLIDNSDISFLKAKNVYIKNSIIKFGRNNIEAEKILIDSNSKVTIGSGSWYDQKHINLKANIYNNGEIFFNTDGNFIEGDIYNWGKIGQSSSQSSDVLKFKGNLLNYNSGDIKIYFNIIAKESETKILNEGVINSLHMYEDIEFSPKTTFNFYLECNDKNVILTSDTKIDGRIKKCNFKSKNNEILNLQFNQAIKIGNWSNFNLIFKSDEEKYWTISEESKFNQLIVSENSKLVVYGPSRYSNRENSYLSGDVVNNGELKFWSEYGTNKSYFYKSIKNDGILTGSVAWEFSDKRRFKYLITENQNLTDEEREELNNLNAVIFTNNLVPKLSEINKKYFLHIQEVDSNNENIGEVKNEEINKKDIQEVEPNFNNLDLPIVNEEIPETPEDIGDKTSPVLSLNGSERIELNLDDEYLERSAMAIDDIDGDISDKIKISGGMNSSEARTYVITYSVSDLAGNISTKTRIVVVKNPDQIPPVISLKGENIIDLNASEEYTELGAMAIDETDGNISDKIKITGEVDVEHTGTYTLTYSVFDLAGNKAETIRTVRIVRGDSSVDIAGNNEKENSEIPENNENVESSNSSESEKVKQVSKAPSRGHSGFIHRRRRRKQIYSCKDLKALNFSNTGKHKQELCLYKKVIEVVDVSVDKKNPQVVEKDYAKNIILKTIDLDKKIISQKDEIVLEKLVNNEEEKYILNSICLNLNSKEKSLRKKTKDKEAVRQLQKFLKKYGYLNYKVDGAYGAITKASLLQFQKDNKLYPDGILGKGTVKWIDKNCKYIKGREYFVKKEEKEKEKQERKNKDFASQNPPQKQKEKEKNILKPVKKVPYLFGKEKDDWWITKVSKNVVDTVISWFSSSDAETDELKDVKLKKKNKIDQEYVIKGGAVWNNRTYRKIKIIKAGSVSSEETNNNNLYILNHGWNADNTVYRIKDRNERSVNMVKTILSQDRNAQILLVDWSDISYSGRIDVSPRLETTWIDVVSNKVVDELIKWKIKPEKTTIIGHSLGSILSSKIVEKLENKTNSKVKQLIVLSSPQKDIWKLKYAINTKGDRFNGFRNRARCFVSEGSWSDAEWLLKSCKERYIVDYDTLNPGTWLSTQHGWTRVVLDTIFKNKFKDNLLGLTDLDAKKNKWNNLKDRDLTGIIYTEHKNPEKIKYLRVNQKDKNKSGLDVIIGNNQKNNLECNKLNYSTKKCLLFGYLNSDNFELNSKSSLLSLIQDFNINQGDKIIINKSNSQIEWNLNNKLIDYDEYVLIPRSYTMSGGDLQRIEKRFIGIKKINRVKIKEWISIADGSYRRSEKGKKLMEKDWIKKQEDNPIQNKL